MKQVDDEKTFDFKKINVLIVEDDEMCQMVLETLFDDIGCQFKVVNSGQKGIDEINNNKYDMLITDINMPEVDGYAVAKAARMKQKETGNRIINVAHSGSEKNMIINTDFEEVIIKSYADENTFKTLIKKYFMNI